MDEQETALRLGHFVEELGLLFSQQGGSPMMGRILGHLLVCDPPEQTAGDLAEALQASRGSISTTTRMLIAAGLVEKVRRPGKRASYYRLDDAGLSPLIQRKFASFGLMREAAARGLQLLPDDAGRRARLQEFHDFFAYLEERWPAMFEDWERQRADGSGSASSG